MPNAYPAQGNATRFTFTQQQISSAGAPAVYDVLDGGGSTNSAGYVGSCSGRRIGEIRFDWVMRRWGFILKTKGDQLSTNGFDSGSTDGTLISAFIATLTVPANICPITQ